MDERVTAMRKPTTVFCSSISVLEPGAVSAEMCRWITPISNSLIKAGFMQSRRLAERASDNGVARTGAGAQVHRAVPSTEYTLYLLHAGGGWIIQLGLLRTHELQ